MSRLRNIFNKRAVRAVAVAAGLGIAASAFLTLHHAPASSAPAGGATSSSSASATHTEPPRTPSEVKAGENNLDESRQMTAQANDYMISREIGGPTSATLAQFNPATATSGPSALFSLASFPKDTLVVKCDLNAAGQLTHCSIAIKNQLPPASTQQLSEAQIQLTVSVDMTKDANAYAAAHGLAPVQLVKLNRIPLRGTFATAANPGKVVLTEQCAAAPSAPGTIKIACTTTVPGA